MSFAPSLTQFPSRRKPPPPFGPCPVVALTATAAASAMGDMRISLPCPLFCPVSWFPVLVIVPGYAPVQRSGAIGFLSWCLAIAAPLFTPLSPLLGVSAKTPCSVYTGLASVGVGTQGVRCHSNGSRQFSIKEAPPRLPLCSPSDFAHSPLPPSRIRNKTASLFLAFSGHFPVLQCSPALQWAPPPRPPTIAARKTSLFPRPSPTSPTPGSWRHRFPSPTD